MLRWNERRHAWPAAILAFALVASACNPTPSASPPGSGPPGSVPPSSVAVVPTSALSSSAPPSVAPSTVAATVAPTASPIAPTPVIVPPASTKPFTPPPDMEPIDDAVCLELASRGDVEGALGFDVGDITAEGTDPNTALTCTYPATGGQLLLATMIGDASAYQSEVDVAISYGQEPVDVSVGDQAFYAARTTGAPEQVTFTKGPVLVRMWNQTTATIGRSDFVDLAQGVSNAIHAEIPPAP